MTRFGFVITTYAATLFVALSSVFPSRAEAALERQRERPDRPLRRAARPRPLHVGELVVVRPPDAARAASSPSAVTCRTACRW